MKKNCKKTVSLVVAATTSALLAFPSMASTSKISSVSLVITNNIEEGDDGIDNLSIEPKSSSKYEVTDIECSNSQEWDDGDKPKVVVTLEVTDADDYEFSSSLGKSNVSLSGDDEDCTVTSVSRKSSGEKLEVKITLGEVEGSGSDDYALDVSGLNWDDSDGTAYWDEAEDAKKYEIKLYRGDDLVESTTTTKEYYCWGKKFTKSGEYMFKVRAVYNSSNKGAWEESEVLDVDSSEAKSIREEAGYTSSDDDSSSSSTTTSTGTVAGPGTTGSTSTNTGINGWSGVGDQWYYYSNGSKVVGWVGISEEEWYFTDSAGLMVAGWQNDGSNIYYMNEQHDGYYGKMLAGYQTINGNNYYFSETHDGTYGHMYVNQTTPDGRWAGSDGVLQ